MNDSSPKPLLLNFGAGNPVPGWLNIDPSPLFFLPRFAHRLLDVFGVSSRSHSFLKAEYRHYHFVAQKRMPIPDSTVDVIYCSHVLEHLAAESVPPLFDEFNRILKTGGIVRIVVPDLEGGIGKHTDQKERAFIDLGEQLGTLPKSLRSSRFRMALEALFGFPSLHKTIVRPEVLNSFFKEDKQWRLKEGLTYLESDITADILATIESASRCQGALIFELRKSIHTRT